MFWVTRDADAERYLYTAEGQSQTTEKDREFARRLDVALTTEVRRVDSGAALLDLRSVRKGERLLVFATIRARSLFGPKSVCRLERSLRRSIDPKTDLIVRSTVGDDASRERYLDFEQAGLVEVG